MNEFSVVFHQVVALIRKELLALFKEPSSRIILFVPVLLQSLLFGYVATFDLKDAPYAVLDQSRSAASTALLARLDGSGFFRRVATLDSSDQIAGFIDDGEALMVLTLPADFAQQLAKSQTAPLQMILDGRNSVTAGLAAGYVSGIVASYNQTLHAGAGAGGIQVVRRAWYNPNLESQWNIMPALIAVLSLTQTLLLAALSVAREREQGTFDQLLVTPLNPTQILIGKAVPAILVGLVQATLIFLIIRFWFQVPVAGSVVQLYVGLLMFDVAVVGIGLSISALALTMQQAMLSTFLLVMPLVMLSGMLTAVSNMPEVLQWLTWLNPLRFGVEIVRRIYLEGAALGDLMSSFVPLFIMAVVSLPLAAWLFRNRLA